MAFFGLSAIIDVIVERAVELQNSQDIWYSV